MTDLRAELAQIEKEIAAHHPVCRWGCVPVAGEYCAVGVNLWQARRAILWRLGGE